MIVEIWKCIKVSDQPSAPADLVFFLRSFLSGFKQWEYAVSLLQPSYGRPVKEPVLQLTVALLETWFSIVTFTHTHTQFYFLFLEYRPRVEETIQHLKPTGKGLQYSSAGCCHPFLKSASIHAPDNAFYASITSTISGKDDLYDVNCSGTLVVMSLLSN